MLAAVALSTSSAPAQPPPWQQEIEQLRRRLDQQEIELSQLRRQVADFGVAERLPPIEAEALPAVARPAPSILSAGAAAARAAPPAEKRDAEFPADAGWLEVSSENWKVRMGGNIQPDLVLWATKSDSITSPLARNYFEFRRFRLSADGIGYGVYDVRVQLTLEPERVDDPLGFTAPTIKDGFFSINEVPGIGRARIGNFFVPSSLEQVTNDSFTVFLERSIPTQGIFTADREPGIAFYNHSPDLNATWTTGIFLVDISDSVQERIDNNLGHRVSGRVTWLPYYDEPSEGRYLLHTGLGMLYTHDPDGVVRFRARPQIHEGPFLIDTGPVDAKEYVTGSVEMAAVAGPVCLQSEVFLCSVDTAADGPTTIGGAYAYATYSLTGENRNYERFGQHGAQFGRPSPYNNVYFVPGCFSLGEWELKARWSYLDLTALGAGQYNDFTVGMNWYWSERVRILFDWIHPMTSQDTVYGSTESNILGMRFDWNW